mmetsp:Transcript_1839/g.5348  ORF Transcript_1839/g.5348 Transcript_1839/m.5348 type:complete len:234 (+) Transcript_1839:1811-2512(+)
MAAATCSACASALPPSSTSTLAAGLRATANPPSSERELTKEQIASTAGEAAAHIGTARTGQSIRQRTASSGLSPSASTSTSRVWATTLNVVRAPASSSMAPRAALSPTSTTRAVAWLESSPVEAGALALYSLLLARRAPSAMTAIFIHTMSSVIAVALAVLAKPQSVPAITRPGPRRAASATRRSAISSGCSTRGLVLSTTPGTTTLSPRSPATAARARRSAPCRGFAISHRM